MSENSARHFCSLMLPPRAAEKTRAALLRESNGVSGNRSGLRNAR